MLSYSLGYPSYLSGAALAAASWFGRWVYQDRSFCRQAVFICALVCMDACGLGRMKVEIEQGWLTRYKSNW